MGKMARFARFHSKCFKNFNDLYCKSDRQILDNKTNINYYI